MLTSARIPHAEDGIATVERELAVAARGRIALTSGVVAAALAALLVAARIAATESAVEPIAPKLRPNVSQYALRSLSTDGKRVELRLWVGTPNEYTVELEAGSRREVLVNGDVRLPELGGARRQGFQRRGENLLFEDGSSVRFETFAEPCPGGTMTSWRVCVPGGNCASAPEAGRCYVGEVNPVAVYRTDSALWAVVEREMPDRVARMAGGVAL